MHRHAVQAVASSLLLITPRRVGREGNACTFDTALLLCAACQQHTEATALSLGDDSRVIRLLHSTGCGVCILCMCKLVQHLSDADRAAGTKLQHRGLYRVLYDVCCIHHADPTCIQQTSGCCRLRLRLRVVDCLIERNTSVDVHLARLFHHQADLAAHAAVASEDLTVVAAGVCLPL